MQDLEKCSKTILMLKEKIKHLEEEIIKYKYDYLTGLPLRLDFENNFSSFIHDNNVFSKKFILGIIDINNLHSINREMGFLIGDSIIVSVTKELTKIFNDSNLYRIGGDEFALLSRIENCDTFSQKIEENEALNKYITYAVESSEYFDNCSDMFSTIDTIIKEKKKLRGNIR